MSLNVRGLRNQVKRRSIFRFLKDQNCLIYFLQEIYSKPGDETIWRSEWGGDFFFSHGSIHSRGVCILINPLYGQTVNNFNKDQNGRIISLDIVSETGNLSVCNIYAPNTLQQQNEFLHSLNEYLRSNTDIGTLVIGGDWNVALYAIDKKGGAAWTPHTYRDNLISMMRELELVDIFRKQYPSKLSYTYESKALNLRSRIDFFLVAQSLINCVSHIGTKVSTAPDHKAVKLILALVKERRGPGLWKFNNSLLEDK